MLSKINLQILKLKLVPEIGNTTILNLHENFPELFESDIKPKNVRGFLKPKQIKNFEEIYSTLDERMSIILKTLEKDKIQVLNILDEKYPELLKEIPDLPIIIFYKGNIEYNSKKSIAIVGTRKWTSYGEKQTQRFGSYLSLKGYSIISGLAAGIDSIAHQEALKNGSKCIGVIGHGHSHIFPQSNWKLYQDVLENNGCIISEFLPHEEPRREFFPMRNRIIAGLAQSTLVIEAARKSGSLITAKLAFDYNRDVYAVPADLIRPNSQGCNELIQKDIAKLVFRPEDIIDGNNIIKNYSDDNETIYNFGEYNGIEKKILEFIFAESCTTDSIAESLAINIAELNLILTNFELEEKISRSSDGKWTIN